MSTLTLKTSAGKDAGSIELAADVFGVQPNVPVMHQAVTAQLAHRRAGTQSTKTRSEVSGGGRKPYKQKGTGNARQGTISAPHYSGGGIALGPKPRKYTQKVNKKMVRLALVSALSDRASEGKIIVVDSWAFDAPSTKSAVAALRAVGVEGKALVVLHRDDVNAIKSFRNLTGVQIIEAAELNAYDILCNPQLVFTKASLPTGADAAAAIEAKPAKAAAKPKAPAQEEAPVAEVAAVVEAPAAVEAPVVEAVAEVAEAPYGAGSHGATADGEAPEGYDIKGNADSMLFHIPGSRFYKQTKAEVWFATEEAAEAAGFSKPGSKKAEEGE
jgi:large subunit ribosomal protein L4